MITIYHNPRCRKSRETLQLLENSGKPFETVQYLKNPLTYGALKELLEKLKMEPKELVRTNEAVWKEKFKGKELTGVEVIRAIEAFPKLMQRPVVVKDGEAILGRPPEKVFSFLKGYK